MPPKTSTPSPAQQKAAQSPPVADAKALAPLPEPVKIPLEPSIKKTVEDRRNTLVINLRSETELEVAREEEVRKGKERIEVLNAEIAEIDAFLARS